jgi:hypothetical protein
MSVDCDWKEIKLQQICCLQSLIPLHVEGLVCSHPFILMRIAGCRRCTVAPVLPVSPVADSRLCAGGAGYLGMGTGVRVPIRGKTELKEGEQVVV